MESRLFFKPTTMRKSLLLNLTTVVHRVRAELITILLSLFSESLAIFLRLGCQLGNPSKRSGFRGA